MKTIYNIAIRNVFLFVVCFTTNIFAQTIKDFPGNIVPLDTVPTVNVVLPDTVPEANASYQASAYAPLLVYIQGFPFSNNVVAGTHDVCPGKALNLIASTPGWTMPLNYEWTIDGSLVSTQQYLSILSPRHLSTVRIDVSYHDDNGSTYRDYAYATINILPAPESINPTIQVSKNPICQGDAVTFTASRGTGTTVYNYTWYINDRLVDGPSGRYTYTLSSLNNQDRVRVEMQAPGVCTQPAVSSSPVIMSVNPVKTFTVTLSGNTSLCNWSDLRLTATPTNISSSDILQVNWYNATTNSQLYDNTSGNPLVYIPQNSPPDRRAKFKCEINAKNSPSACLTNITASDTLTVRLVNSSTPSIKIRAVGLCDFEATGATICAGRAVTFEATSNGGSCNWYLNGAPKSTGNSYTVSSLNSGDYVYAELTSNTACFSGNKYRSNVITMNVTTSVIPTVSVSASPQKICSGETATFTAHPTGGGLLPRYTWRINGVPVPNQPTTSDTYSTNSLNNQNQVSVILTSSETCATDYSVLSDPFTMTVGATILSEVALSSSGNHIYQGDMVAFTASATEEGPSTRYYWKKNGQDIPEASGNIYSTSNLNNGDEISVNLVSDESCVSSINSNSLVISIYPRANSMQNHIRERIIQKDGITGDSQISSANAMIHYTYYNDLGKPGQTVAVGASSDKKDIVTPITYDAVGRQDKQYLPYVAKNSSGKYRNNAVDTVITFYSGPPAGVASDTRPWSETVFEPSPLNQMSQQWFPGKVWYDNNKYQDFIYRTNTASDQVRLWNATDSQVSSSGYYNTGTLFVTETTDEDNRRITEYTDLLGRLVCQVQKADTDNAITDYAYNDSGQLAYVLPPAIDKTINQNITVTDNQFLQYIYAYRYDARERVKQKHIPGAGWTYIVYNQLDLPVMTQNAEQRTRSEWSYTKYDIHGRVIISGLYDAGELIAYETLSQYVSDAAQWESRGTADNGYSRTAYPTNATNSTALTVNYYDNYDFDNNGTGDYTYTGSGVDSRIKGFLTGSKVKVMDSEDWLVTALFYDNKGRILHSESDHILGGKDQITNQYDFTSRLTESTRTLTGTPNVSLSTSYEYDHAGRLLNVKQNTGNGNIVVAGNNYNELGQLSQTILHEGLETIGYNYNIRGWLKEISSEWFRERLHYNTTLTGMTNNLQWAGNIAAFEWQSKAASTDWNAYTFKYDDLSRLTYAYYKRKGENDNAYSTNVSTAKSNYYSEEYTYNDLMGNINKLKRRAGKLPNSSSDYYWDNLEYFHEGNRVIRIRDYSNVALGFADKLRTNNVYYTYDAAGRLLKDKNQQIDYVYNHLHLVKEITKGTDKLEYTYDATGRRLKKKFGNVQRYYLDGIEVSGDTLHVHTPYGRMRRIGANDTWKYDYFLKDHLGNIRVVLNAGQAGTSVYTATMEENKASEENLYFNNLDNTRADRPYNYPDNNPVNAKIAKVPGKSRGPAITLKVMAGDTVSISAKAFYNIDKTLPGGGIDIAPVVGSAVAAMSNPAGMVAGETAQLAADLGATASQSGILVYVPRDDDYIEKIVQPKSGINFVAYNNEFDIVASNTGVQIVDDKINTIQTLATDRMVMQEAGFLEIFVNNEAQMPVYFDNLMVTQTNSPVVEVNAYYPSGTLNPALGTLALPEEYNAYKYNAKELQKEFVSWLDYGARMLEPAVGRWWVPDPLAENHYNMSPYLYAGNNPILFIDPDGQDWYSYEEEDENGIKQTRFVYSEDYRSQKDLKKAGIDGKYLGMTYKNSDTYFSLLGEQFNIKNEDGSNNIVAEAVENIDVTLFRYYEYENSADGVYNAEPTELRTRDMSVSRGVSRSYKTGANSFYFSYGEGQVKYNIATNMTGGYFDWGKGEMKPLTGAMQSEGEAVNTFVWKKGGTWDFVNWRFSSVGSWQSTKQRVERLFKNR